MPPAAILLLFSLALFAFRFHFFDFISFMPPCLTIAIDARCMLIAGWLSLMPLALSPLSA